MKRFRAVILSALLLLFGAAGIYSFRPSPPSPSLLTGLSDGLLQRAMDSWAPSRGQVFRYHPSARIPFRWSDEEPGAGYILEIAKGNDFSRIFRTEKTDESRREIELPPGRYSWRVRKILKTGETSAPSEARVFEVRLPQPEIVDGDNDFVIDGEDSTSSGFWFFEQEAIAAEVSGLPLLRWRPVASAKRYRVYISNLPDFKSAKTYETETNSLIWQDYLPGHYYWKVYAVDAEGREGDPSSSARFSVRMKRPVAQTEGDWVRQGDEPIPLKWSPIRFAREFELEIRRNSGKRKLYRVYSNKTEFAYAPPRDGQYVWRVRALGENREPITRFSKPAELRVSRELALEPPKLGSPGDGEVVEFRAPPSLGRVPAGSRVVPVEFDWTTVEGADQYEIQVAIDPGFDRRVASESANAPNRRILLSAPDTYYWRVRAKRGPANSGWSEVRQVSLNQSVMDLETSESSRHEGEWEADLGVGISFAKTTENQTNGLTTSTSALDQVPSFRVGAIHADRSWEERLSFSGAVNSNAEGVSRPVSLGAFGSLERKQIYSFGWADISFFADLSFEQFSQAVAEGPASSLVSGSTSALWVDAGPKLRFEAGMHQSSLALLIGHSLIGEVSDAPGVSLSGFRAGLVSEWFLTTHFYAAADFFALSLQGNSSVNRTDADFRLGVRF